MNSLLYFLLVTAANFNNYGFFVSARISLVSVGKTVSQSSEYASKPGPAINAIDGNHNQHYFTGKSCTHTELNLNPWWKIDLGSVHDIHTVKVWNRGDGSGHRLTSLKVQASDDGVNFKDVDKLKGDSAQGAVYTFSNRFSGRFVRLILAKPTPEYLTFCEVEIYGRRRKSNDIVSYNKKATQSSESAPYPGPASLAVDGNKDQNYNAHKSCTHTNLQAKPWWQVDLGSLHNIYAVKVWNRGDCCGERLSSLKVQKSDDGKTFQDVDELKEPATNGGVYTFNNLFTGRYVRLILSKPSEDYLTVCEVEVYGYTN